MIVGFALHNLFLVSKFVFSIYENREQLVYPIALMTRVWA